MLLSIFKLSIASLVPVAASILFYRLETKTNFANYSYKKRQIIIGIVFGLIAIMGTEWGIPVDGFLVNSRDAAPIAAGLLFGGPAGIIAGLMGGIERWFAVYWGAGAFTRVACSVSTCLAGFYAAGLRKFLFENKKPTWGMALGAGLIMEVFHLSMVFITNVKDATKAIDVVEACFVPMVLAVGISVMLSSIAIAVMAGEFELNIGRKGIQSTPIFEIIQRWLLIVLAISFTVTIGFSYILQNNMSLNETKEAIYTTLDDVTDDIEDASNAHMIELARMIDRELRNPNTDIDFMSIKYEVTEINLVGEDGIIFDSNINSYIGFDMASGEQSAQFLCLLDGTKQYSQAYGATAKDDTVYRKYAGVATDYGFIQVSYDEETFQKEIARQIASTAVNRHIGQTGGAVVFDNRGRVVSISKNLEPYKQAMKSVSLSDLKLGKVAELTINDVCYFAGAVFDEGYYITGLYPEEEAVAVRDITIYVFFFSMLIVFAVMFVQIYMLIKNVVVNQIEKMTESLSTIAHGNLNEVVDVRSTREFSSLSDDINSTVDTLKRYIAEAAARIDKELEFAKTIQASALPSVFPNNERFGIYASMDPAKSVGGDFYDFYRTAANNLNFLIADVSGKGIPAAMFMMKAKSVLKSTTERGYEVNEVFSLSNAELCEGNDAEMFVTAWQGVVNFDSGILKFANAGHNLPVIKHPGGQFEFHKQKINFVLAGMEGVKYALNELQLQKGDIIYLYTDGVTEATNAENELYGEDRLINILNAKEYSSLKEICESVRADIDAFVKEADQFDDITMVAFEYKG